MLELLQNQSPEIRRRLKLLSGKLDENDSIKSTFQAEASFVFAKVIKEMNKLLIHKDIGHLATSAEDRRAAEALKKDREEGHQAYENAA